MTGGAGYDPALRQGYTAASPVGRLILFCTKE
jgi:hypothetical protein